VSASVPIGDCGRRLRCHLAAAGLPIDTVRDLDLAVARGRRLRGHRRAVGPTPARAAVRRSRDGSTRECRALHRPPRRSRSRRSWPMPAVAMGGENIRVHDRRRRGRFLTWTALCEAAARSGPCGRRIRWQLAVSRFALRLVAIGVSRFLSWLRSSDRVGTLALGHRLHPAATAVNTAGQPPRPAFRLRRRPFAGALTLRAGLASVRDLRNWPSRSSSSASCLACAAAALSLSEFHPVLDPIESGGVGLHSTRCRVGRRDTYRGLPDPPPTRQKVPPEAPGAPEPSGLENPRSRIVTRLG